MHHYFHSTHILHVFRGFTEVLSKRNQGSVWREGRNGFRLQLIGQKREKRQWQIKKVMQTKTYPILQKCEYEIFEIFITCLLFDSCLKLPNVWNVCLCRCLNGSNSFPNLSKIILLHLHRACIWNGINNFIFIFILLEGWVWNKNCNC